MENEVKMTIGHVCGRCLSLVTLLFLTFSLLIYRPTSTSGRRKKAEQDAHPGAITPPRQTTRFREGCPDVLIARSSKSPSQKGPSQKGLSQKGLSQKGLSQKDLSQKDLYASCIHHTPTSGRRKRCRNALGDNKIQAYNAFRALTAARPFGPEFQLCLRRYIKHSACRVHVNVEKEYVETLFTDFLDDITGIYDDAALTLPSYSLWARPRSTMTQFNNGLKKPQGDHQCVGHHIIGSDVFSMPGAFPVIESESNNLITELHKRFQTALEAFPSYIDLEYRFDFAPALSPAANADADDPADSNACAEATMLCEDESHAFQLYTPRKRVSLNKIIEDRLGERSYQKGTIYIFSRPDKYSDGYLKIGMTTVSSNHRLNQWRAQCGKAAELLYKREASNVGRVERLIHAEFQKRGQRFVDMKCKTGRDDGCNKQHNEWFKASLEEAKRTVDHWIDWMDQLEPYEKATGLMKTEFVIWLSAGVSNSANEDADAATRKDKFLKRSDGVIWLDDFVSNSQDEKLLTIDDSPIPLPNLAPSTPQAAASTGQDRCITMPSTPDTPENLDRDPTETPSKPQRSKTRSRKGSAGQSTERRTSSTSSERKSTGRRTSSNEKTTTFLVPGQVIDPSHACESAQLSQESFHSLNSEDSIGTSVLYPTPMQLKAAFASDVLLNTAQTAASILPVIDAIDADESEATRQSLRCGGEGFETTC